MKLFRIILVTMILLMLGGCANLHAPDPNLHLESLQSGLEKIVEKHNLQTLVSENRLGIALMDLSDQERPQIAEINSTHTMYAASLPKIAILFALFKRVEEGSIIWTPELQSRAEEMIRFSSNDAATELFYRVGPDFIRQLLLAPAYRLYDEKTGGGLWVGKEYGQNAAWYRDPVGDFSHAASPIKVAQFYYLLDKGRLVQPQLAKQMKAVLGHPGLDHKFVRGMKQYCPSAVLYRKSGSWRTFHSDSALIEHGGRKYIAVVLIDDVYGSEILEELIVEFDELIAGKNPVDCRSGI